MILRLFPFLSGGAMANSRKTTVLTTGTPGFSEPPTALEMLMQSKDSLAVPVVPRHPQILADLSQPKGANYAHQKILEPPDFHTFRRSWCG